MGSKPADWRLQWETLLGGFLALAAAISTVLVMRWQTNHLIERKEMATRAMLPLYLASINEYTKLCLYYLKVVKGFCGENELDPTTWNWTNEGLKIPEFPENYLSYIKDYIENADETDADRLAKYVATIQVHRSRMLSIKESFDRKGNDNFNLIGSIRSSMVDAAEIYKATEKALEFSRGESKIIGRITPEDIQNCLWWFIHFDYESDRDLKDRAKNWTPLLKSGRWSDLTAPSPTDTALGGCRADYPASPGHAG